MLRNFCSSVCRAKLQKNQQIYLSQVNDSNELKLKCTNSLYVKTSAKILVSYHKTNGPYKSVLDLLPVNEIRTNLINKFCTSTDNVKKKGKRYKFEITPNINGNIPETMLAIHTGPSLISWALINKNYKLLNWDCENWECENKKYKSYIMIKLISRIINRIPLADAYIIEDIERGRGSRNFVSDIQQQLGLTLATCCSLRNGVNDLLSKANVYILHSRVTSRFFNLIVGSETVSTRYALKMKTDYIIMECKREPIQIYLNDEIKIRYMLARFAEKEQMNWSLLKALAFLQLAVYKID